MPEGVVVIVLESFVVHSHIWWQVRGLVHLRKYLGACKCTCLH